MEAGSIALIPLLTGSLMALIVHLALTLGVRSELRSVAIRAVMAVVVFLLADWYLELTGYTTNDVVRDLGLEHSTLWKGIVWAAPLSVAVVIALAALSRSPRGRKRLQDPRYSRLTRRQLFFYAIGILVGTVALEEILFRGLLFAAWGGESRLPLAVAGSSTVFGLWHVGPAIRQAGNLPDAGRGGADLDAESDPGRIRSSIITTVFFTAAVGAVFSLLRAWSDGIWAPALLHWVANSSGVVFSKISADQA